MAFAVHHNNVFEVSDQLIATLGRTVEKHRKGVYFDYSLNTLVNTTDEYIRREHQYRPDMGPKRLTFQALEGVTVVVSPKVGVAKSLQEPYFVLESALLGQKVLVRLSEGLDKLNAHVQRLLPLSEERYAQDNKGELKSELQLDFCVPRISIYLKPTKPHRVDREKLSSTNKPFVDSLATGLRLQGKLLRGTPAVDENGATPVTPAKEKKEKQKKNQKKALMNNFLIFILFVFNQKQNFGSLYITLFTYTSFIYIMVFLKIGIKFILKTNSVIQLIFFSCKRKKERRCFSFPFV